VKVLIEDLTVARVYYVIPAIPVSLSSSPYIIFGTDYILKSSIFWDIKPCSSLKVKLHFGVTRIRTCYLLHAVPYLAHSSTMKKEAICSSETLAVLQQTMRHYISEDRILHSHHCENLKSYIDYT
jgi:hypothetical protein